LAQGIARPPTRWHTLSCWDMLGIADYDSDESAPDASGEAAPADASTEAPKPAGAQTAFTKAPPFKGPPPEPPRSVGKAKAKAAGEAKSSKRIAPRKLAEIHSEVSKAKSATAVVQVLRREFKEHFDVHWGAEALYQIAKRSTARTRKQWSMDADVMKLADKLRHESTIDAALSGKGEDLQVLFISLEALRRMSLQDIESQRQYLERAITRLATEKWQQPVKALSRLFWLGAPLKLEGMEPVPEQLRRRVSELDGSDVTLLVAAMRLPGMKDKPLLEKVAGCLKNKGAHDGLAATDLVELSEGLAEFDMREEAALRPLGQELQRRRGELTPDEAHRIQNAFQKLKLPLGACWAPVGASMKRDGAQVLTTQAFAPQEGHEKKRRGNNDVERTSPPRVVRDYKMMSY